MFTSTQRLWRGLPASGFTTTDDLNISAVARTAQQSLYYLSRLIRVNLTQNQLVSFYRCTTENILTNRMAAGTKASKDGLQHGVKTAQDTGGTELPSG